MINWDGRTRKQLRQALQSVYPDYGRLEIFVVEELDVPLATISEPDTIDVVASRVIKRCGADCVYDVFKRENPNHPLIAALERPLVRKIQRRFSEQDWSDLFGHFGLDDLADLRRAFFKGFKDAMGFTFQEAQAQLLPLSDLSQLQEQLSLYGEKDKGPDLAVRFVDSAIAELRHSDETGTRDLDAVQSWRDRIAERFAIPPPPPPPAVETVRYAYLLITLVPLNDSQVMAYPELRLTGREKPVPFGAKPVKETADKLADSIAQWIDLAEIALGSEDGIDSEVTLELFLPCRYLLSDRDVVSEWQVPDPLGAEKIALINYRRLVVRSADRALIRKQTLRRQIQQRLSQNWQRLQACVQNASACSDFHRQLTSPSQPGELRVLLNDRPGLKFLAPWPTENDKQTSLINEMIFPAVPIALWSSESGEDDADILETEFDTLLRGCQPTSFVALAELWRRRRIESPVARPIRLLCDCPERLPRLPDSGDVDQPKGLATLPECPPWRQFMSHECIDQTKDKLYWRSLRQLAAQDNRAVQRGKSFRIEFDKDGYSTIVEAVNASIHLRRPLLVTGDPGSGKTSLAYAIAHELQLGPVLKWPITAKVNLIDAEYRYDAIARLQDAQLDKTRQPSEAEGSTPPREEGSLGDYLQLGPVGTAFVPSLRPRVLLIDEIDKSDLTLPNDLLNLFEEGEFEIPELKRRKRQRGGDIDEPVEVRTADPGLTTQITNGRVQCCEFPLVIMTSNGEREFPPAFYRRCLRVRMPNPTPESLRPIVRSHFADTDPSDWLDAEDNLQDLIETFLDRGKKADRATDQLLNAIHLMTRDESLSEVEMKRLQALLFKRLSDPD